MSIESGSTEAGHEKFLVENKSGFVEDDKFGSEMGIGTLYAKMDWGKGSHGEMIFGFKPESVVNDQEGPELPIMDIPSFPNDAKIDDAVFASLKGLPEVTGPGGSFVIGEIDGKKQVVCMDRWGMNSRERRTAEGWVEERSTGS